MLSFDEVHEMHKLKVVERRQSMLANCSLLSASLVSCITIIRMYFQKLANKN